MELDTLLNPMQKVAVEYNDGPSMIVAGAGSGKTRVLTYKIAFLIECGVHASNIMALTFTNKAAKEMKDRIANVVGYKEAKYLWMGTFHSIFLKILRTEADAIGFNSQFTIYDTSDTKSLIKSIVKELKLNDKTYTPTLIASKISALKNQMIGPIDYANTPSLIQYDAKNDLNFFSSIYTLYCTRCKEANAMDFDDILVYTYHLLSNREDIRTKYQNRFEYILVDEYQDTNKVQHAIVSQLVGPHGKICVVGDDAQSIYSFRGAQIDNMLTFQSYFPNTKLFKLEQNYRSTQTIVNAANSLIAKNEHQIKKRVYSERGVGSPISVIEAYTDNDEAVRVTQNIVQNISNHLFDYQDIAILYRTNAQSRVIEDALRKEGIPYKIYGGLSFYQRKEIKDILAYLRLMINPYDEESFKRVINYPARGIGDTTVSKVITFIHTTGTPLFDVISNPKEVGLDVNNGTASKLMSFAGLIKSFVDFYEKSDAFKTVEHVMINSGMIADVEKEDPIESESRKDNLKEFLNAVQEFCETRLSEGDERVSLEDFLSEVSLLTDQDNDKNEKANVVTLMTVHASKGLEYGHVYIVGMEENLFPSQRVSSARELEEERRLFYVAITRAKECCTVSYAKSRFMYGQSQFSSPSRFLYEIDSRYIDLRPKEQIKASPIIDPYGLSSKPIYIKSAKTERDSGRKSEIIKTTHERKLKPITNTNTVKNYFFGESYTSGDEVVHSIFGKGTIISVEGEGDNAKAKIEFETHGIKLLLLRYARLKKL